MPRWFRHVLVVGVATVVIAMMAALWGISGFRSDVLELAASSGNTVILERAEQAIRYEQIIMFGILAISILLTTMNLGLFKRGKDEDK